MTSQFQNSLNNLNNLFQSKENPDYAIQMPTYMKNNYTLKLYPNPCRAFQG